MGTSELKQYQIKDDLGHLHIIEAEQYRQMADTWAYFLTGGQYVASFKTPHWVKEIKKK